MRRLNSLVWKSLRNASDIVAADIVVDGLDEVEVGVRVRGKSEGV